jgi:CheY-like chemotaxis protein
MHLAQVLIDDQQQWNLMPKPTLRLLFAEDSPADVEIALRELRRAGISHAHLVTDSPGSFVSGLKTFRPDVILADFSMPRFDGMEALSLAREHAPATPFIFVSGTLGEEYAIRALRNGAVDYVLKTNLARLPPAIERAFDEAEMLRERQRIATELEIARERLEEREAALSRAQAAHKLLLGSLTLSPAPAARSRAGPTRCRN